MVGGLGFTVSAESGEALTARTRSSDDLRMRRDSSGIQRVGVSLDGRSGALDGAVGLSWLREDRTVLGARFHDALGRGGADSLFADARAAWSVAPDWRLGAAWRGGITRPGQGGAIVGGSLLSSAFAVDVEKLGVFADGDRLAVRLSQPLRVEHGGVRLNLPVDYDYATLVPTFATSTYALTPQGRELIGELAWRGDLWGGDAMGSVFYRKDPGHYAAVPDDKGVAVKWSRGF
jgi:hypothetical protein